MPRLRLFVEGRARLGMRAAVRHIGQEEQKRKMIEFVAWRILWRTGICGSL
jgi:hypothetical protein